MQAKQIQKDSLLSSSPQLSTWTERINELQKLGFQFREVCDVGSRGVIVFSEMHTRPAAQVVKHGLEVISQNIAVKVVGLDGILDSFNDSRMRENEAILSKVTSTPLRPASQHRYFDLSKNFKVIGLEVDQEQHLTALLASTVHNSMLKIFTALQLGNNVIVAKHNKPDRAVEAITSATEVIAKKFPDFPQYNFSTDSVRSGNLQILTRQHTPPIADFCNAMNAWMAKNAGMGRNGPAAKVLSDALGKDEIGVAIVGMNHTRDFASIPSSKTLQAELQQSQVSYAIVDVEIPDGYEVSIP